MTPSHTELDIDLTHVPVVRKLMNDNSGAAIVLINLLSRGRRLGVPVSEEAVWCLTTLDSLGIYGADLYVLWANVCSHSIDQMCTLLRDYDEECKGTNSNAITQAIASCNLAAASNWSCNT